MSVTHPQMRIANPLSFTEPERRIAQAYAQRHDRRMAVAEGLRREVASLFVLSVDDLTGRSRRSDIVDARSVLTYVMRLRGFSQAEIGRLLGRDHSTISYLQQRVERDFELHRIAEEEITSVEARRRAS